MLKISAELNRKILDKSQLTMYDLPSEDQEEPGLPDTFHDLQPELLRRTFRPPNYPIERVFSASDLNLYFDQAHPLWHKRPDWFGVVGVSRLYQDRDLRLSYVVWDEKVNPLIVVELLSKGTADEDLGKTQSSPGEPPTKWQVYEQILGIKYYLVFSREMGEMKPFILTPEGYQEMEIKEGRISIEEVDLEIGLWRGEYEGENRLWLRWYDTMGNRVLTVEEEAAQVAEQRAHLAQQEAADERHRADAERHRADAERQRADAERQRAELAQQEADTERQRAELERERAQLAEQKAAKLAERLRELGLEIEPD